MLMAPLDCPVPPFSSSFDLLCFVLLPTSSSSSAWSSLLLIYTLCFSVVLQHFAFLHCNAFFFLPLLTCITLYCFVDPPQPSLDPLFSLFTHCFLLPLQYLSYLIFILSFFSSFDLYGFVSLPTSSSAWFSRLLIHTLCFSCQTIFCYLASFMFFSFLFFLPPQRSISSPSSVFYQMA